MEKKRSPFLVRKIDQTQDANRYEVRPVK
jgi:hypothetical protein